ncbi:MAG: hypothetical protein NT122_04525 [Solirubrobacterales bacterium]|nr:hypothetical protein [Solirubrobacterales bacterium]
MSTQQAPKVLILSADIGEGHDAPARAIVREFREQYPEAAVSVANGLTAMGGVLTSVVRDGSEVSFKWFPFLFEVQYLLIMKLPPTRWLARKLLTMFGGRPLLRIVRAHTPDLIISTYPGVTAVLGELRLRGKLTTPVIASITDLAGLYFWAHKGVDLHVVTHRESTETVEKIAGSGSVRWGQPPTTPAFLDPPTREAARTELGLPTSGEVIIISGGGWGVGDVTGGIEIALERPNAQVVVLCGRNEAVKSTVAKRFAGEQRLTIVGFTDRMATYLSAGDVLVHATGGLTALEAMICGTQVISYGFGVGHVRENNRAYLRLGLAQVVKRRPQLAAAIDTALEQRLPRDPRYAQLPSTAELAVENDRWVSPTPTWRLLLQRAAIGLGVAAVVLWLALGSGLGINLIGGPLRIKVATSLPTSQPLVGVILDAPQSQLTSASGEAKARGLAVSVAVDKPPSSDVVSRIRSLGSEPMPRLQRSGAFRWIATRSRLKRLVRQLSLGKPFPYQPPDSGFSVGEYEAAKRVGGRPVRGQVQIEAGSTIGTLTAGELVEVHLDGSSGSLKALDELSLALRSQKLRGAPVSTLLNSK